MRCMETRIANVILEGTFGGPQSQILQVAARLEDSGIRTIAVIPKKDSCIFARKLEGAGVPFRKLHLHRLQSNPGRILLHMVFLLPEVIKLALCLRREGVALVHCNTSWQIHGVLAGKLAGCKIVLHLHDTRRPWPSKVLFGLLGRLSDAYVVAGRRARERYFTGLNGVSARKRIAEIQAPVDTAGVFNPENATPAPEMLNDGGLNITTVGNINPDKGIEYFVGMASALNDRYDNLAFHVVGARLDSQAHYADRLSDMVQREGLTNLRFHGYSGDVASVLKATDVFVCSSVTEASPMAVWEAMAMEKAVVSTDVGDVATYLHDGVNGCVVHPEDSSALAEKVGALIEDEELRATFGRRARATAIAELDISVCVDKHRSLYMELLADST